ncbi:hypothetical protein DYBT9275_00582 [Dyadobacter sp. CECT 9275]|uniref:DUF3244 domain-containing protein n=1 Tax=Dyadobacter helix TaxID=2822344 RepID=A0A916J8L0_9BACT|nr:DUF3324 domain-containing protein [Dyadobacter sp. CECT 9275]CAG4990658.1 hypothetical protein DYBT9275_00582 [Dyadobacter sp. CECT 9275]
MKNSLKSFAAIVLFVSAAFSAQAEEKKSAGFGTNIYSNKEGKIHILVDKNDANAPATLILKSARGTVVYRETVPRSNVKFGRVLNIEALEAGKYQIDVIIKNEKQTKSFEVSEIIRERVVKIQ